MTGINIWAVLVAAVSSFMLGGLWYSNALFCKAWCRAGGKAPAALKPHPPRVFAVSLLFAIVSAAAFAMLLGPNPELAHALKQGLIVGACIVAASFGINYQFSDRTTALWLIDGGYHTAQFLIYGLVLGLWH